MTGLLSEDLEEQVAVCFVRIYSSIGVVKLNKHFGIDITVARLDRIDVLYEV